jgi:hypothetical protein
MLDDLQVAEDTHNFFVARNRAPPKEIGLRNAIGQSAHGGNFHAVREKFDFWSGTVRVVVVYDSIDDGLTHGRGIDHLPFFTQGIANFGIDGIFHVNPVQHGFQVWLDQRLNTQMRRPMKML